MTKEKKIAVTIDNKQVEVRPNITILQAAGNSQTALERASGKLPLLRRA